MCMYIHDYAWIYIYIHTTMFIYNYLSAAECVGGHQMDRGKNKQQMDGPGRIRARNHLLQTLLQKAPGA